jgi:hypothetical protein
VLALLRYFPKTLLTPKVEVNEAACLAAECIFGGYLSKASALIGTIEAMDSLASILNGKIPEEAPEIGVIKKFVYGRYKVTPKVALRSGQVVIGVPNAALAGALRPLLPELQELCGVQARLVLRIE